ncbi:MAG TPA: rhamnogalacturonan lyase [Opitutaceae bacterium]|nr:rhamnogalacturonan lyase [Opitutaceae bacterium]
MRRLLAPFLAFVALCASARPVVAERQMEALGRGVVAINQGSGRIHLGWRLLGTDPDDIAFNLYRSTGGAAPIQLNAAPLTQTTDFVDLNADATQSLAYFVRPVLAGAEQPASAAFTLAANAPARPYLSIPLTPPPGGVTPDGISYTYTANDCSAADLDGDGEYELILKWDPTNSKDNSQSGYTGDVFLDAYKLDGTRLWRIDLGRNIRAGAHYTQFMVYDLDGDGRAELACKTADGTVDGVGHVIGDATADYRNASGYVLRGPEFLTIFDGLTGAALATTNYVPARNSDPKSEDVSAWGDNYGNRVDRFLAGVAYLDGERPSLVMCRGYYTRTVLVAWDWRGGQLTQRWKFDTRSDESPRSPAAGFSNWEEMGNHQLAVADIDGDGRDEILYGAIAIDDDGHGLYTTGRGHGDAYHVSDLDPDRPGLEIYGPHETPSLYGDAGSEMHDARTGEIIWSVSGQGADVGRGVAIDIDPRYRGAEMWSARGGLYSAKGELITNSRPSQMNFAIWWDADLLREILDGTTISKWDWINNRTTTLLSASGCSSNNSTKSTPCLSADLFGDWREEVVFRSSDNRELRIYTTTIPATNRLYTLMHDPQYRLAIAWQNVAYNQPPHPGFFLGDGMSPAPRPAIRATYAAPIFSAQPTSRSALPGETLTLTATTTPNAALQWQRNGVDVPGATAAILTLAAVDPATTGLYAAIAANGPATTSSQPAIVGLASTLKLVGSGREVLADIPHANGNIYDQILLTGAAATVTADAHQVLRTSFLDLDGDIVQVELAGAGALTLVLDNSSGPTRPTLYRQDVDYMQGHAGIVVTGADETTSLSVFSVGRANALDQSLFRDDVSSAGIADLAFIAISSPTGKFGALRAGNASFFAAHGLTGVYAPGITFAGPVFVGNIDASDTAQPVLALGAADDVRITGGDLQQANARAVELGGLTRLSFTAGMTSHGRLLPAQPNRARFVSQGADVTGQISVTP